MTCFSYTNINFDGVDAPITSIVYVATTTCLFGIACVTLFVSIIATMQTYAAESGVNIEK